MALSVAVAGCVGSGSRDNDPGSGGIGQSAQAVSACSCSGTGLSGPITVSCGQSACGVDNYSYDCSASGWTQTGILCGGADLATNPPDLAGESCSCSGNGKNGPVTVSCGQTACGQDDQDYLCSNGSFVPTGNACASTADLATPCTCSGTGPNGPVTAFCGGSACGADFQTYNCSANGWAGTGQGCTGSTGDMSSGSCSCSGTGINGPVTVSCGGSACGVDSQTYNCSAGGWAPTGQGCSGGGSPDLSSGSCSCSGNGINGPVTVSCGGSACGADSVTYSCSASGWSYTGQACSGGGGADMSSGSCTCSGNALEGPVTVSCGQWACGQDNQYYSCGNGMWSQTGNMCTSSPDYAVPQDLSMPPDLSSSPDLASSCYCLGVGLNGPVQAACGGQACGNNHLLYDCSAAGWSQTTQGC